MARPTGRPGVAAFDFDGTVTRRDTLGPFLTSVAGGSRVRACFAAESARSLRAGRRLDRDRLKLGLLHRLLAGQPSEEFSRAGLRYAELLPARFRDPTVEALRWHQRSGHRVLLVSASLGVYLRPVAAGLGVDDVISVEMVVEDGVLTGETLGPNVRGPEKAARLRAWLGEQGLDGAELWAYGNSRGDAELLAMADHPTWTARRARSTPARGPVAARRKRRSRPRR